jgi:hypothetical protein
MFTLTDRHNTVLTISQTNEGGLHLQIEGGPFNLNQTTLNAQESQEFLAGLKAGKYDLSRALADGGLELMSVRCYSSVVTNSREYQMLIGSSIGGTLNLGSFFFDSLDEVIAGVAELLEEES